MAVNTKALPKMAVRINGILRKQFMMTIAPLLGRSSVRELLSFLNESERFISPLSNLQLRRTSVRNENYFHLTAGGRRRHLITKFHKVNRNLFILQSSWFLCKMLEISICPKRDSLWHTSVNLERVIQKATQNESFEIVVLESRGDFFCKGLKLMYFQSSIRANTGVLVGHVQFN